MFLDAGGLAEGAVLDTDLCIIGAGPAGITIARELADTDVRVLVLESGSMTSTLRTHRLTGGPNVGESYHRLLVSRDRAFAGTSPRWPLDEGWHARPLDPIDFETRPGVPHSGWPITYHEMARFLPRAQEICDLGPLTYDPADWASPELGHPLPLDRSVVSTTVFQLGTSHFGRFAPEIARSSTIRVVLRATVVDIATDESPQRVDRLVVARPDGRRFDVRARTFVLATGGIDNARVLLMSNRSHTRGLGNSNDVVGRFFMERLSTRSGFVEPASPEVVRQVELYENKRVPPQAMPAGSPERSPINLEAALQLNDDVIRAEGLRNSVFFVLRRSRAWMSDGVRSAGTLVKSYRRQPLPEGVGGHIRNVVTGWRDIGTAAAQRLRPPRTDDLVLLLRAQAEQTPNPDSRVTLSRRRDHLGSPRAQLEWRTSAADRASIRRSQELIGDAFSRAGLGTLVANFGDEDPPAMFEGNWHHMGSTRMSHSPKTGVVDADCKVHGLENLFVAGSSVFPTAGASNPTLTIVALSLRLAEHLRTVIQPAVRLAASGQEDEPSGPAGASG